MDRKLAENIIQHAEHNAKVHHKPYTVVEVENFLPEPLLRKVLESFPAPSDEFWETSLIDVVESKRRTTWSSFFDIPNNINDVVCLLNSSLFLKFGSKVLDIKKLMPDPYFTGGGLNESFTGDYLDVHVDGNYHDASGLNRRVNAILYLSEEWKQEWGGNFGIYSDQGKTKVYEIVPKLNTLVLFDTSDVSYHGYPEPITCPTDVSRRSLILYYYTKDKASTDKIKVSDPHSALWVKRDHTDKNFNKTRKYT